MPLALGVDDLLRLAPDAASAKAAKGLVIPAQWPRLEYDATALWGECQGSGAKPYQTQIDLSGPAFRCTCPSRKFPCKHGLALALLYVQHPAHFRSAEPPGWVSEWLASRTQRAERQERGRAAPERPSAPADPQAAARREATRFQRMREGMLELEAWLADRLRQGLAQLPGQPDIWEAMAARLVDAQLPGLAYRLRRVGARVGIGEHWPVGVLAGLGRLQLLIEGARRLDALPPLEQADLRAALGLALDKEAVLATGERITDHWRVLGVRGEAEDRLWLRRVWLAGRASGRQALLLDYRHGNAHFEPAFLTGDHLAMTLAFYPSAAPLRALVLDTPQRLPEGPPPQPSSLASALAELTERMAAQPWQSPWGLFLDGVPQPGSHGDWRLRVTDQGAFPLALQDEDAWALAAVSAGVPVGLFGEWDGERLRPLSAWGPHLLWTGSDTGLGGEPQ